MLCTSIAKGVDGKDSFGSTIGVSISGSRQGPFKANREVDALEGKLAKVSKVGERGGDGVDGGGRGG